MHRLTKDEKVERERQDEIYLKARQEKQQEVDAHALQLFFYAHRGDGIFLKANEQLLREHLLETNLPVTVENLELAYRAIADRLASRKTEYVRQTEARVPLAQRHPGPASIPTPIVLSYTAAEFKAMALEEIRKLIRRPEYRAEVQRILAVKL